MAEFDAWIPPIRMEEEEEAEPESLRRPIGYQTVSEREPVEGERNAEKVGRLLEKILNERQAILADDKLATRDKLRLLEANHRTLLVLRGGRVKVFKTEAVVFGILGFSTVMLLTLSVLNVKAGLSTEITLTFLGTTLGGTIATIAQKLGRI